MEDKNPEKTRELSRNEVGTIMTLFETEPFGDVNEGEDFEDITNEIFEVVDNSLEGMSLICSKSFTFEETMTSFEIMDKKMDMRFQRNNVIKNNSPLIKELDTMDSDYLSQGRKLSLMRELLL